MTGLRARHSAETRRALLAAAKAIVLSDGEVTARTVAAKAGLSTGALFRNWKRMWDLQLEAAADPAVRDKLIAARQAEIDQLRAAA